MDGVTTVYYIIVYPIFCEEFRKIDLLPYGLKIFGCDDESFRTIYDNELKIRLGETQLETVFLYKLHSHCAIISTETNYNNLYKFFDFLTIVKPSSIYQPITEFQINYFEDGSKQVTSVTIPLATDILESLDKTLLLGDNIALFHRLFKSFLFKVDDYNFHVLELNFVRFISVYKTAIRSKQNFLRLIIFMIIVEMLVVDSDFWQVSKKIKNVTAKFLGYNKESSRTIFENIGLIYNVRSAIVHSADLSVFTEEILDYLHRVCCEILNTFMLGVVDLETVFTISQKYELGDRGKILDEFGITDDQRFIGNSALLGRALKK